MGFAAEARRRGSSVQSWDPDCEAKTGCRDDKIYKKEDFAKDVVVASVDVDENEETPMEQLEKLELPTIQLFHNGACVDTTRPRKDLEEYSKFPVLLISLCARRL